MRRSEEFPRGVDSFDSDRVQADRYLALCETNEADAQSAFLARQDAESWNAYKNAQEATDEARNRISAIEGW